MLIPNRVLAQPDLPDDYTPPRSFIDLSELEGDLHGFSILGEVSGDHAGKAVATGDINGDAIEDVIIGAHFADPNGAGSGKTYIIFGKKHSRSSEIQLSGLDGTNGFVLNGEAVQDRSGFSLASGDVNRDGYDDVIIGAYGGDGGNIYPGKTYVFFGKNSGFSSSIELSGLNGSNGFVLNGENGNDNAGYAVASGDINGDNFDDIIIGAYFADPNGHASGKTYVFFGKNSGYSSSVALSGLNGSNGFSLNGEASADGSGRSVNSGDINGDGYEDVIIGARSADPNGSTSGKIYVFYGKSSGFSSSIDLSTLNGKPGFILNGESAGDQAGRAVASGDITGDGIDDLVIGAIGADPNGSSSGRSYVYFGKSGEHSSPVELFEIDGSNGFSLNGEASFDGSGGYLSAGDINGDGYEDVIIGATDADPNGSSSGKTYVYFGKSDNYSSSIELSQLNGVNGFSLNGESFDDHSGSVSSGDINGDGIDDVLIGAESADPNGSSSGKTYVFTNTAEQTISGDEGFRMLGTFASGKVFDELLSPFWTQGFSYSDAPPFGPNAWTWDDESQSWEALTDQRNNTLKAGSGFLFYMFSDDDNNGTADGFPKTITSPASLVSVNNFDYLVNTDIVYPFTELPDNDFFLVSNPYTSEIEWDAVSGWTKTNLSNTIYIWSDADNAWLTWNGSSGSNPDEGVIAPFQSFFVQASGGPGSLTIKEGAKTSTSGSLHKSGTTEEEDVVGFELVAETEEAKSVAFLTLHPEGTTERDIYEGIMLNPLSSKYLQLGLESKMNKEIYSIYSLPRDYSSNLTIPLYLNGMNISSEADFHVKIPEGFEPKWEFILRDTQTGRETQLTNKEKVKVTVDINNSEKLLEGILSNLHNDQEKAINQESRYELILNSYINTSVNSPENDIPENIELHQNYPNPFNPTTTIHYQLPSTDYVKLEVFDLMGRKVTTLVSKRKEAGSHHVSFDAQNLASGTYIYQLRTDETVITKKLTLIK